MSTEPTPQELLQMTLEQEQTLQFDTLTHEDVWRLGNILAELTKTCPKPVGVEIKVNGLMLFTYYPEGASEYYRMVLARKHNTANVLEKSSLRLYAECAVNGLDPAKDMLLDPNRFQFRGGAFPIRLRGGCVVGSVCAAGMAHTEDHALLVRGLRQFFAEKAAEARA